MCLLTCFKPGVMPDTAALWNGTITNDDGHGYAIVAGDRLIVHKGMRPEDVITAFVKDREAHPEGPAIFHSRFGTGGALSTVNVHPFTVSGDPRTVLAHNGVIPELQPGRGDPRCDTAVLAAVAGQRFGSLRHRRNRIKMEKYLTSYNRVAILTVNRKYRGNLFILNEDSGTWTSDGIWYSNDGYKPYKAPAYAKHYGYGAWKSGQSWYGHGTEGADAESTVVGYPERGLGVVMDDAGVTHCAGCKMMLTTKEEIDGLCDTCDWCLDCDCPVEICLCFQGGNTVEPTGSIHDWTDQQWHSTSRAAALEVDGAEGHAGAMVTPAMVSKWIGEHN